LHIIVHVGPLMSRTLQYVENRCAVNRGRQRSNAALRRQLAQWSKRHPPEDWWPHWLPIRDGRRRREI